MSYAAAARLNRQDDTIFKLLPFKTDKNREEGYIL